MSDQSSVNRRDFMTRTGLVTGMLAMPRISFAGVSLPRRQLGRTGVSASVLGLGCSHLHQSPDLNEAVYTVQFLYDCGVNYFDTASNYGCGRCDSILGRALGSRRGDVLIAGKTFFRNKTDALNDLEKSLKRLGTDVIDVWLAHNPSPDEWKTCLDENGVIAAMEQAKREGKCRFTGITGLGDPNWTAAYLREYPFDVVQVPLNCADPHYLSFERELLPAVDTEQTAIAGWKPFLSGALVNRRIKPQESLSYAMSLPVSLTVAGCRNLTEAKMNLAVAMNPVLTDEQREDLLQRAKPFSNRDYEWYKRMV